MSNLLQEVGRTVRASEASGRAAEFVELAKFITVRSGLAPPDVTAAREALPARAKAAVAVGSTSSMAALAPYRQLSDGFLESLRSYSAFDAMLPFARRAPLQTHVVITTAAATAGLVAEGATKPLSKLSLVGADMAPKSAAVITGSSELFKLSAAASNLFAAELKAAVALSTDQDFLGSLYAGVTPTATSGSTTANTLTDLDALLSALTLGVGSRVFIAMSPANLAGLLTKVSSGSGTAYPLLKLDGGEWLGGITVIPTTAIVSGGIIAFDASGIVATSETLELRSSGEADVQMDSSPDSPPTASTTLISLWHHNLRALLVERYYSFVVARTGAVSAISGAAY